MRQRWDDSTSLARPMANANGMLDKRERRCRRFGTAECSAYPPGRGHHQTSERSERQKRKGSENIHRKCLYWNILQIGQHEIFFSTSSVQQPTGKRISIDEKALVEYTKTVTGKWRNIICVSRNWEPKKSTVSSPELGTKANADKRKHVLLCILAEFKQLNINKSNQVWTKEDYVKILYKQFGVTTVQAIPQSKPHSSSLAAKNKHWNY